MGGIGACPGFRLNFWWITGTVYIQSYKGLFHEVAFKHIEHDNDKKKKTEQLQENYAIILEKIRTNHHICIHFSAIRCSEKKEKSEKSNKAEVN